MCSSATIDPSHGHRYHAELICVESVITVKNGMFIAGLRFLSFALRKEKTGYVEAMTCGRNSSMSDRTAAVSSASIGPIPSTTPRRLRSSKTTFHALGYRLIAMV